jgi:hypothetical protein
MQPLVVQNMNGLGKELATYAWNKRIVLRSHRSDKET